MRDIRKETCNAEISEHISNKILPAKHYLDNIISITAGPTPAYVRVEIDADIVTIGLAAYILMERYKQALEGMVRDNIVPENTDALIKDKVQDYMSSGRTGITMIRKDDKNGQN